MPGGICAANHSGPAHRERSRLERPAPDPVRRCIPAQPGYVARARSGRGAEWIGAARGKTAGHRVANHRRLTQVTDASALDATIAAESTPGTALFHRYLTQDEFNARFAPSSADQEAVIDWLHSGGLSVTHTYSNHLLIDAQGSIDQIDQLLNTFVMFTYSAPLHGRDTLFLCSGGSPYGTPAGSAMVQGISGLDGLPRIHAATAVVNGRAHETRLLSSSFANAYDLRPLWTAGAEKSTGQRIGITMWTAPQPTPRLSRFSTLTSAAPTTQKNGRLHVVKVDGGTTEADDGEAAMDIEYSGGMAPGPSRLHERRRTDGDGNPTDRGIEDALNLAGSDGFRNLQITNSWGECEPTSADDPFVSAVEAILRQILRRRHAYYLLDGRLGIMV